MKAKKIVIPIIGGLTTGIGALGASMAATGTCVACLVPIVGFLGALGISLGILLDYNIYFIIAGILLLGYGIYSYKTNKICKVKIKKQK